MMKNDILFDETLKGSPMEQLASTDVSAMKIGRRIWALDALLRRKKLQDQRIRGDETLKRLL
jgi:hypothetical protein